MLHAYGPQVLLLLINMETAGLLFRREDKQRGGFPAVRKSLKLVVDDLDDANPADVAYAYSHSGYAPTSVRLAQAAVKGPWKAVEDSLKSLPGMEGAGGGKNEGVSARTVAHYFFFFLYRFTNFHEDLLAATWTIGLTRASYPSNKARERRKERSKEGENLKERIKDTRNPRNHVAEEVQPVAG